jgi:hypothetical protein
MKQKQFFQEMVLVPKFPFLAGIADFITLFSIDPYRPNSKKYIFI